MDRDKLATLVKNKTNYKLDFKQLCILKKEYDLNLLQGIAELATDPITLAKVLTVALKDSAPELTVDQVEEMLSLSDLSAALEGITAAYVKHFGTPKKSPSGKK